MRTLCRVSQLVLEMVYCYIGVVVLVCTHGQVVCSVACNGSCYYASIYRVHYALLVLLKMSYSICCCYNFQLSVCVCVCMCVCLCGVCVWFV